MLFNSYEFIFLFLPIVLLVFFTLSFFKIRLLSIGWLVAASLFFMVSDLKELKNKE